MAVTIQAAQTDSERQLPAKGKNVREIAPATSLVVVATRLGTYPDPGEVKAKSRSPGDKFVLSEERHFSAFWMKRLAPGEDATVPIPVRTVPQTTAPVLKKASPFPPQP